MCVLSDESDVLVKIVRMFPETSPIQQVKEKKILSGITSKGGKGENTVIAQEN